MPELIEQARQQGHPAFDDPELRNTASAKEILIEKPELVFFCSQLGEWFPATFDQMRVIWSKGNAKPLLQALSHAANNERVRKRRAAIKAKNTAGLTETVTEKFCPSCQQTLPASAFGVSILSKDGLHTYCKACKNDRNTNREYSKRQQTPEHLVDGTKSAWSLLAHVARVAESLTGKQYHRDHLVPISSAVEGQTFLHQPSNLRLMEASANSSKGDRPPTTAERLVALQHKLEAEYEGFEWTTADGLFSGTGEIELADLYDRAS
jgi:RNase P subunit RPR2